MLYIRVRQPAHNESIAVQNWRMGRNCNSRQVTHTLPSWWDTPRRTIDLHVWKSGAPGEGGC